MILERRRIDGLNPLPTPGFDQHIIYPPNLNDLYVSITKVDNPDLPCFRSDDSPKKAYVHAFKTSSTQRGMQVNCKIEGPYVKIGGVMNFVPYGGLEDAKTINRYTPELSVIFRVTPQMPRSPTLNLHATEYIRKEFLTNYSLFREAMANAFTVRGGDQIHVISEDWLSNNWEDIPLYLRHYLFLKYISLKSNPSEAIMMPAVVESSHSPAPDLAPDLASAPAPAPATSSHGPPPPYEERDPPPYEERDPRPPAGPAGAIIRIEEDDSTASNPDSGKKRRRNKTKRRSKYMKRRTRTSRKRRTYKSRKRRTRKSIKRLKNKNKY